MYDLSSFVILSFHLQCQSGHVNEATFTITFLTIHNITIITITITITSYIMIVTIITFTVVNLLFVLAHL